MTAANDLLAFTAAAALLTILPGLDTALVIRTSVIDGTRAAARAGAGIVLGCLAWGVAVALGASALIGASAVGFSVLRWIGAAYLLWLGIGLLRSNGGRADVSMGMEAPGRSTAWLRRGLLTNLLNPKVGLFYLSFLPQFVPSGVPAASWMLLLACVHAMLGAAWFTVLIVAGRSIGRALARPGVLRSIDRATGLLFVSFGLRLALARR